MSFIKKVQAKISFPVFDNIGSPILGTFAVIFLTMEARRQLRKRRISWMARAKRNVGLATTAFVALRLIQIPVFVYTARWAKNNRFGLLHWISLPVWLQYPIAFFIQDYGSYTWHRMTHRFPFLWRFHNVHHCDLDLDMTTAFRFHAGEILVGVFYRGAFIGLSGATPLQVLTYEIVFEAATNFHHSNWKLPYQVEKWLSYLIVTPRMHGIHHSIVRRETDSNFSVIFSMWDRMHGTVRLNVPQDDIDIGVPAYRDFEEQTVGNLITLPFKPLRPWQLPDGTIPERTTLGSKGNLEP